MDDKEVPNLLPDTLATIASSVAAYREEAWDSTKAMDVRLEAFERNVERSDGSDIRLLTEEALRISARARRAFADGSIEPSAAEFANTAALLDPRGYDNARRQGVHREFQYDPMKVVTTPADQRVMDSPRPTVPSVGPHSSTAPLAMPSKGAER